MDRHDTTTACMQDRGDGRPAGGRGSPADLDDPRRSIPREAAGGPHRAACRAASAVRGRRRNGDEPMMGAAAAALCG